MASPHIERTLYKLRQVVARGETRSWLRNHLHPQKDPNVLPVILTSRDTDYKSDWLLELFREMQRQDPADSTPIEFVDAAHCLLEQLIRGDDTVERMGTEYLVDVVSLLQDFKVSSSTHLQALLQKIGNDPAFDISDRGRPVREMIAQALWNQTMLAQAAEEHMSQVLRHAADW